MSLTAFLWIMSLAELLVEILFAVVVVAYKAFTVGFWPVKICAPVMKLMCVNGVTSTGKC